MSNQLKAPTGAQRSSAADPAVRDVVREVIEEVRAHGDEAVRRYSEKFDHWSPESFKLDREQIEEHRRRAATTRWSTTSARCRRTCATSPSGSATPCTTSRSRPSRASTSASKHLPIAATRAPTCPAAATRSPPRRT